MRLFSFFVRALSAVVVIAGCATLVRAQGEQPVWDSTATWGKTRQVSFKTTEGTWMSVDISPDGDWIVFDLLANIYRVPTSGGTAQNLTKASGAALNFHPRFSPDGGKIAFVSDRNGQNALWLMNADGGEPTLIFQDDVSRISDPKWTSDGRGIIAVRSFPSYSFERQSARIWYFPADGSQGARELVGSPSGKQAYWPAPEREGRFLYYQFATFGGPFDGLQTRQHIRRLDLSNGEDIAITASPQSRRYWADAPAELAPEVSPDGEWLAFARRIPGAKMAYRGHVYDQRTALWLRNLKSGAERILMDPITPDMAQAHGSKNLRVLPGYSWAADSRSLVLSVGGGIKRIWLADGRIDDIPFEASVERKLSQMARSTYRLSDNPFLARAISWPSVTLDGSIGVVEAGGRIWRIDLRSGKAERLTSYADDTYEYMPQLSPDGRWVAFVTWDNAGHGAIWKIPVEGGEPTELTPDDDGAAERQYLHPVWSPDGASLVVVRDKGVDNAGRTGGHPREYEALRLSASGGGQADALGGLPGPMRLTFGPGGALYMAVTHGGGGIQFLLSQGLPVPRQYTAVEIFSSRAGDAPAVAEIPTADEAVLSPSGRWLAYRRNGDLYLADLKQNHADYSGNYLWRGEQAPATFDESVDGERVRRISNRGGYHAVWVAQSRLIYMSGATLHMFDTESDETKEFQMNISLPRSAPEGVIAFTGARIISLAQAGVIEHGDIVIRGTRLACVGVCKVPPAAKVIDVAGKTIAPGYVDVHAHHLTDGEILSRQRSDSAIYLAHGVTTVLDPYVFGDAGFRIAELIETGRMVGPRTFSTGAALNPIAPDRGIADYADAVDNIIRLKSEGAISIKDFLQPLRSQRQMLGKAALENGMSITNEGADLFYDLGTIIDGSTGFEHPMMYIGTYNDVAQFFGQAGAVYSPTLTVGGAGLWAEDYFQGEYDLWNDPKERRYLPWRRLMRARHPEKRPLESYSFPLMAETVADIKRAGGRIALGGHGEQAGLDTLWEMMVYGQALSPLEVLEIASKDGAYMAGLETQIGSLEAGKFADLVVLNNNPLDDIRNVADIAYVMKGGILYDDDTLDEIWPQTRAFGTPAWMDRQVYDAADHQRRLDH